MKGFPILIGTSTGDPAQGIRSGWLDAETGRLHLGDSLPMMNPSWLTDLPGRGQIAAVLEVGQWQGQSAGALARCEVSFVRGGSPEDAKEEGTPLFPVLSFQSVTPIAARGPCHAIAVRNGILCAGYATGIVSRVSLDPNVPEPVIPLRPQDNPATSSTRAHQVVPTPDGRWLACMDIAQDKVFLLPPALLEEQGYLSLGELPETVFHLDIPKGTGPRHLVFSVDGHHAYLCGEYDNRVHVCEYDGTTLVHRTSLSALPDGFTEKSFCAAIRLSPDGRFLLVSNRGHDSIAVFPLLEDGLPGKPTHHACGGHNPRDMAFSPDGRWLLTANHQGDTVGILSWQAEEGRLSLTGSCQMDKPTAILFVDAEAGHVEDHSKPSFRYDRMLEGRRAVVTGGAQGLGRAIALLYAQHGAKVAITDIAEAEGRETEILLKAEDPDCFFLSGDAGNEEDLHRFSQTVLERFGYVDLLDNNVGINIRERIDELDEAHFERIMSVNLRSAMFLCKAFLPGMKKAGGGSIVFTSTIHSVASFSCFSSYAASKGAVNAYARVLAIEHGPDNIRVNVVLPGGIRCSVSQPFYDMLSPQDHKRENWVVGNPMPTIGYPEDVANAHLFFAGPMARRVTGTTLQVDGGSVTQLHKTDAYPYPDTYPMSKRLDWFRQDWAFRRHGGAKQDVYAELGVKTYINAWDTMSVIGGSRMEDHTLAAMKEAAKDFVSLAELQERVGAEIARLTHNEAAYVTGGASAGLVISAAICMAGGADQKKLRQLPDTTALRNEIIVMKGHRNPYDFAIRASGATLVEAGDAEACTEAQLIDAFTARTAAIFYFDTHYFSARGLPLKTVIRMAHERGVFVVVDGAAQLPPVENLWHYTRDMGADLAVFSGGKGLRGPQQGGVAVGSKAMIAGFALIAPPNHGIARSFKVGREEILGVYTALKHYVTGDHLSKRLRYIEDGTRYLISELNASGYFHCTRLWPGPTGQSYPWVEAELTGKGDATALVDALKADEPGVMVGKAGGKNGITLNVLNLEPSEIDVVIDQVVLHAERLNDA